MRRLFVTLAAIAALMLVAGTAMAGMKNHPLHFYGNGAVLTNVEWLPGQDGKYGPDWNGSKQTVHGVQGYNEVRWGNTNYSFFERHSTDTSNDLDSKTTSYYKAVAGLLAYEANYLKFDIRNGKGLDAAYKQPGKLQVYTGADYYWDSKIKGDYKGFLDATLDFYYLSGVNGDTDMVFMQNEFFRLGEIEHDGTTYYMDIQINISEIEDYTKLEGAMYDQAYNHLIAMGDTMTYGDELWGVYIKPGKTVSFDFDILAMDHDRLPKAPPVPVPAAAWLLGTGLAGLAALRKRNAK